MKRPLSLCLIPILLCAVMLSGCREPEPELKDSFDLPITVSGEPQLSATLNYSPDTLTVTVTSPAALAGLTYAYTGGELTTSYNAYSCISDTSALPPSAFTAVLYEALNSLDRAAYLSSDSTGDTYALSTASGEVRITLSGGLPVKISGEHLPYEITMA